MTEKTNWNRLSMYLEPWTVMKAPIAGYYIYSDQLGYVIGSSDKHVDYGGVANPYTAHVIAAAPEMITALMAMTTSFHAVQWQEEHYKQAMQKGLDALHKATFFFKEGP